MKKYLKIMNIGGAIYKENIYYKQEIYKNNIFIYTESLLIKFNDFNNH